MIKYHFPKTGFKILVLNRRLVYKNRTMSSAKHNFIQIIENRTSREAKQKKCFPSRLILRFFHLNGGRKVKLCPTKGYVDRLSQRIAGWAIAKEKVAEITTKNQRS